MHHISLLALIPEPRLDALGTQRQFALPERCCYLRICGSITGVSLSPAKTIPADPLQTPFREFGSGKMQLEPADILRRGGVRRPLDKRASCLPEPAVRCSAAAGLL